MSTRQYVRQYVVRELVGYGPDDKLAVAYDLGGSRAHHFAEIMTIAGVDDTGDPEQCCGSYLLSREAAQQIAALLGITLGSYPLHYFLESYIEEGPGRDKEVTAYVCGTTWDFDLGNVANGTTLYPSPETLQEHRTCWKECGIVEVKVRFSQWIRPATHK